MEVIVKFLKNIFKLIFVGLIASQTMNAMNEAMTQYAAMAPHSTPPTSATTCSCPAVGNSSIATNICTSCDFYENSGFDSSESTSDELDFAQSQISVESQVKELAQIQGLGQKTANLVILDQIAKDETLKSDLAKIGFKVEVPEFVGISSQNIKDLLRSAEFDLNSEWRELLERSGINSNSIQESLEKQTLPENFVAELKGLAAKLEVKFNEIAEFFEKEENQSVLAKTYGWIKNLLSLSKSYSWIKSCLSKANCPKLAKEVLEFLSKAPKNGWQLMVRSTGKEDTKQCPNAGGNKSAANVAPTLADVIRAIGQVIISYFFDTETGQPKSLMQRLKCGDKTIFDTPFTPVLIQRMIGENFGLPNSVATKAIPAGVIPVGCVVYTQESEGSTPGISSLQCSFGHPEGVVESSVGIDTCWVDENKNYHCIIKTKSTRLVPECEQDKCKLVSKPNPDTITTSPALDEDAIKAFQIIAAKIQSAYGEPMDLEFAYTPETKTIYFLQARPISVITLKPEYIKSIEKLNTDDIVSGLTVCVADASLRFINNPTEVIMAVTLDDALKIFNDPDPKNQCRNSAKCVVVQKNAESNSHAAAIFRGANLPILIASDYAKIENWVKSQAKLVMDIQREIIVKIDQPDQVAVTSGWFSHPLPNKLSVMEIAQADKTKKVPAENFMPDTSIRDLIELIKESDAKTATKALSTIIFIIQEQIDTKKVSIESIIESNGYLKLPAQDALQLLENLKKYALGLAQQIQPVLNLPARDIKRLYYINWLEALLTQSEDPQIEKSFSLASISEKFEQRKTFIEKHLLPAMQESMWGKAILENLPLLDATRLGHSVAMTPELENKWLEFVAKVTQSPQTLEHLKMILQTLEQYNIMPLWINSIFNAATGDAPSMLAQFIASIQEAQGSLTNLASLRQDMLALPPSAWSKPEKFEINKNKLQALITRFIDPTFVSGLTRNVNKLSLAATLSTMDTFVETVDLSIKELKASTIEHKKVERFIELLGLEFSLLKAWTSDQSFKKLLETIEKRLGLTKNYLDDHQLLPSEGFSVSAAAFGSFAYCWGFNEPETAEDIFTLIHQDLLVVLGVLTNNHLEKSMAKSATFSRLETILLHQEGIELISTTCTGTVMHAHYNARLRDHSISFDVDYNKQTSTTQLIIHFYGNDEHSRWDAIEASAWKNAYIRGDGALIASQLEEFGLSLSYRYQSTLDEERLISDIKDFIGITFAGAASVNYGSTLNPSFVQVLSKRSPQNYLVYDMYNKIINGVEKGQEEILAEVTAFAVRYSVSQDDRIRGTALDLFSALFKKNYPPAFDEALHIGIHFMNSLNFRERELSFKLFIRLVEHDHIPAFNKALRIAIPFMDKPNHGGQNFLMDNLSHMEQDFLYKLVNLSVSLFKLLIEHNHIPAIDTAMDIVIRGKDSPEDSMQILSSMLVGFLVEHNYQPAFKLGNEIVLRGLSSADRRKRDHACEILEALINKGLPSESLQQIAATAAEVFAEVFSAEDYIISMAEIGFLTLLIKKGLPSESLQHESLQHESLKQIAAIATKGLSSTDEWTRKYAHKILDALSNRGLISTSVS